MDYGSYGDGAAIVTAVFVIYAIVIGITLLFVIALYIVTAFAFMSFFRKVGVKPWIAWVPYYSTWVRLEVGGQMGWLALLLLISPGPIVTLVFMGIGMHRTGFAFRKDSSWVVLGVLLPFVWAFLLGRESEVYDPALIAAQGFPPPLAGYGSVTNNYANVDHVPPTYPAPAA